MHQGRIIGRNDHLRDNGCHSAIAPRSSQGIFQRLLNHVSDPPRRRCDENAQWEWLDGRTSCLVTNELVSDLRPVAVYEADIPPNQRQIDDTAETLTSMSELILNCRAFVGGRKCVSTERNDRCPRAIGG